MIGVIVKLAVEHEQVARFEQAFSDQAVAVRTNEPGNRLYELFRSGTQPGAYMLVEIYDDEVALEAHRNSPHMAAHRPYTATFVVEPPEIEMFDVVRPPHDGQSSEHS